MMKIDGEKAFGRVAPGFERRVRNTLILLRSQNENKRMKAKRKFTPLITLMLLILMAGLALAMSKKLGLWDFLR